MKISYEWLQTFFADGVLPEVSDVEQKLIFHAYEVEGVDEVGNDYVLDVDILPNRSSDCLSHRGVAREVATLFNLSLSDDPFAHEPVLEPRISELVLSVDDKTVCPIHTLALIQGVKVGPSPEWLVRRLEAIGQKSINNVVDATNYVMYELGQPTHAFDYDKLEEKNGTRGIHVRVAHEGEHITLLDGKEYELSPSNAVLSDAHTGTALDVAGVKGGTHAELTEDTVNVLISAAKFDPVHTRKSAQQIKVRTDASTRFENEVPDQFPALGITRVVTLITSIAGGEIVGFQAVGEVEYENPAVTISSTDVNQLLGTAIDDDTMVSIFDRLGFTYEVHRGEFSVTAPFERRDIRIPEDVVEEVGRVHGYNNITSAQTPAPAQPPRVHKKFAYMERVRSVLSEIDFSEVYLYTLRPDGDIALRNALASDKDHLRSNLKDGIEESLEKNEKNMPLLGLYSAVRLFEIGNIFSKSGEATHVCLGVRIAGTKKREAKTHDELIEAKAALEAAFGCTLPEPEGETLEFSLDALLDELPDVDTYPATPLVRPGTAYSPLSPYPFVLRDIAVWLPDGIGVEALQIIIEKHAGELLQRSDLFDTFAKDGRVSYALHLVFQSCHETLTDAKVGEIMHAIEAEIATQSSWEIR